jgi:hypothetical protein
MCRRRAEVKVLHARRQMPYLNGGKEGAAQQQVVRFSPWGTGVTTGRSITGQCARVGGRMAGHRALLAADKQ